MREEGSPDHRLQKWLENLMHQTNDNYNQINNCTPANNFDLECYSVGDSGLKVDGVQLFKQNKVFFVPRPLFLK